MLQTLLDICICTCRRPEQLRRALASLAEMQLPADLRVSVTVVDNDPEKQGLCAVQSLAETYPLPIASCFESSRGIPYARNRCIREALAKGADYLVFIDDDEWVERDWLVQLVDYARGLGGESVVCGTVISKLPTSVPEYYSMFFSRKRRVTGERLPYCATNNVLVPLKVVRDLDLRFDEERPFAGGEDVLFFTEAAVRGVEIAHCAEAVVYEAVPECRATIRWLSRRKYSVGITLAKQKLFAGRTRSRVFVSALLQLISATLVCVMTLLPGSARLRARSWLRMCRSAGMACGVFGAESQFYRFADH